MTDEGFQVETFINDIKQLRMNYTSYNLDEVDPGKKRNVLKAIARFSTTKTYYSVIEIYEWAAKECSLESLIYDPHPDQ